MISNILKKFFRKRMKPMPVYSAFNTREKLSLVYMFVAWNALALVGYNFYHSDKVVKDNSGKAWAEYLGLPNATVYRFSGLKKISTEVIKETESEKVQ